MNWGDIYKKATHIVNQILGNSQEPDQTESSLVKKFSDTNVINEFLDQRAQFDHRSAFTRLQRRALYRRAVKYSTVAASVLLLLGALFFINFSKEGAKENGAVTLISQSEIKPIEKKARIVLSDGMEVDVTSANDAVVEQNGKKITISAQGVNYKQQGLEPLLAAQEVFNTVVIPRGGEYFLTLADGTKVWMNSESELRFPVSFVGNKRVVYLKGEAYFEVAKDASKPFFVTTSHGEVKVLGTEFNVKCYGDESSLYTTLVEGSVAFIGLGKKESTLLPGQQLRYEKETGEQFVRDVNVENYISWRENSFRFQELTLEEIMKTLSRWYNITYNFENNDIKNIQFSGNLDKYGQIEIFFNLFEASSNVEFVVSGTEVTIKARERKVLRH